MSYPARLWRTWIPLCVRIKLLPYATALMSSCLRRLKASSMTPGVGLVRRRV